MKYTRLFYIVSIYGYIVYQCVQLLYNTNKIHKLYFINWYIIIINKWNQNNGSPYIKKINVISNSIIIIIIKLN